MDFQCLAILAFGITFLAMKALAIWISPKANASFLVKSPLFAPFSQRRSFNKTEDSLKRLKKRLFIIALASVFGFELYNFLFKSMEFSWPVKAWLFAPYIYIFTSLLGLTGQCLALLTKELPADIHNHPYLAKSLSEFWGKRWNTWVGDWLAVISKKITRRPGEARNFVAFALSGIFHELIIALPFYIYSGQSYFGYMSVFFLLQYVFVGLDKKVFARGLPSLRRAFFWLALLAPMPLFNNPSVLAFFGF